MLILVQYYFAMPSETSSLLPGRKVPSVDSGAPFPPVAELEQMPVGDLEGSLPSLTTECGNLMMNLTSDS